MSAPACLVRKPNAAKGVPKLLSQIKAIAEALALLGQSRIANNLNQIAYQANIGALEINPTEREQIEEAYAHIVAIRALLVSALGKSK